MGKKKSKRSTAKSSQQVKRQTLPEDLERRLRAVWLKLGHFIEWCQDRSSWTRKFCLEARPYRETFYWEAVAEMVSDYMLDHPTRTPEAVLTDCLVATQHPPSSDDTDRIAHFREAWEELLARSKGEIEAFIKADLELARQDGICDAVARLYAEDHQGWEKGKDTSA